MLAYMFIAYFWITVSLSSPLALILWILDAAGFRAARSATGFIVRAWARSLVALVGIRAEVSGLDRIPRQGPICYISNHQGNFDIVLILAYLPGCIGFITKSQAVWAPFLNIWILALGGVFIDRRNIRSAHMAMKRGSARLQSGGVMAIFPEGTRSRGPSMGQFRNGSFKLATKAGAVIVPVSIQGTYRIWEETGRLKPAAVSLRVHEPLATRGIDLEGRKRLPEQVHQIIDSGL
ncbi:MAG TPA: lysophospholipid acyltransferase family protein [Magnetospirillaceae bacterium]|nr:lysophospholipid acyltransferase family protein [Magnetospirillaceae bacterium]